MHVAALDRKTGLPGIHERTPNRAAGCDVHVRVVEHQHGIFSAQLQHDWQQARSSGLRDALARGHASGEDEFVDCGVQERRACGSVADDNLKNVWPEHRLRGVTKQVSTP